MKKIICLFFFHLTLLSFGQHTETKSKLIKGFVFDNSYFASIPLPIADIEIEVKGTERKTKTDDDGKFVIEVVEGDELLISDLFIKPQRVLITDKNCYEINLGTVIDTYPVSFPSKKVARQNSRYYRKLVKKLIKKMESGFYDCID